MTARDIPDVLASATLGPITLRNRIIKAATFEAATPRCARLRRSHRVPPPPPRRAGGSV